MVQLTSINMITTSCTLSQELDNYLINAGVTGMNITLPFITNNGMNYNLIREDITGGTVTIEAAGSNIIYQNLSGAVGSTGSIRILPQTTTTFQSYNDNWYVLNNASVQRSGAKSLFSTAFVSNSGGLYYKISGPTRTVSCYFSYPGSNSETISSVELVISNIGGAGITGSFDIRVQGSAVNIGTGTFNSQVNPTIFYISSFSQLPSSPAVLELGVTVSGGSNSSIGINSLTVR
jgi:hypothetical protein